MRFIDIRPPRIAMTLTLIAATIHWSFNIWESTRIFAPWTGVSVGIAGFFLIMWSWLLFKKRDLAVCPLEKTAHIAIDGPYRFSRNPMYLGMVFMMLGLALYVGTMPFYLSTFGYFAILNFVFCPYEEDKLAMAFGDEYIQYMNRVRRWI